MKPGETVEATEAPAAPWKPHNASGLEEFQPAWVSLAENPFVNDPSLSNGDRAYLRGIQDTWRYDDWNSMLGCDFEVVLVWDHDHIWGSFNLCFREEMCKGVLMVDHGPPHMPPRHHAPLFHFTWRASNSGSPLASISGRGAIKFGETSINGYFDGLVGGDPDESYCHFDGRPLIIPQRVERTVKSFIDEWNHLKILEESGTADIFTGGDSGHTNDEYVECEEVECEDREGEQEDCGSDEVKEALRGVSGLYDITSDTVSEEWPDRTKSLTLRLHFDDEQDMVRAYIDMGISEGYLRSWSRLSAFAYRKALKLYHRCRDKDTGTIERGVAEVTLLGDDRIRGSFYYGVYGNALRFEGKKELMPRGISGRETWYYRQGWKEYGQLVDRRLDGHGLREMCKIDDVTDLLWA